MKKQRKPSSYTEEFRREAARLAYESPQPINAIAQELGVHGTTLYGWVTKYYPDRVKPQECKQSLDPQEELKQLKKELRRVTMERDILKKAAAYFAGETL